MPYSPCLGPFGKIFAVPAQVVEKHIKMASGVHLKVLLIALYRQEAVEAQALAQLLGLPSADIQDALNYWVEAGILTAPDGQAEVPGPEPEGPRETLPPPNPPAYTLSSHKAEETGQAVTVARSRGRLSKEEINEMSKVDANIPLLLQEAQMRLGKTLSSAESEVLIYLYSFFNLTPDYILMAIEYCKSIDKAHMRYVEKVVTSWVDAGIDSHDKAEGQIKKLARQGKQEKTIKTALQIFDRDLTAKERQFIAVWTEEWHFNMHLIKLAFERTVDNTGKLSFPYMNKILDAWFQKGIKTPAEAEREMAVKSQQQTGDGKEHSYDMNKLEWMLIQGTMTD